MKHWTDRLIKYAHIDSGYLRAVAVYKDSTAEPIYHAWHLKVGQLWYRDNFPVSYVMFLTFLMRPGNISRWHKDGLIEGDKYEDMLSLQEQRQQDQKYIHKILARAENWQAKELEFRDWARSEYDDELLPEYLRDQRPFYTMDRIKK